MKTCVAIFGTTTEPMKNAAHEIAEILLCNGDKPSDAASIMYTSLGTLDAVLKGKTIMPDLYLQAEKKLLMGIDGESVKYLERVMAEIKKSDKNDQKEIELLQMSDDVLAECRRRGIQSVYVHDMPELAVDPDLLHKLRNAGMQACDNRTESQNDIDLTLAAVIASHNNEQTVLMMNRFRNQLSYLASLTGFQVAVFGWQVRGLWEAEKLSKHWGPELMDGYKLYLEAAANWIRQTSKNHSAPPPHSLK